MPSRIILLNIVYSPREPYCRFNRGSLYLTLGYYQKAIDDFSEALTAKPKDFHCATKCRRSYRSARQIWLWTISALHSNDVPIFGLRRRA